jgi:hypothetical protein
VRLGARLRPLAPGQGRGRSNRRLKGKRQEALAARRQNGWRIEPRDNYMTDALADSRADVQRILQQAFAAALFN